MAPSTLPWITTLLAFTVALILPFGPTIRPLLRSSMLPSTCPSTYKSSEPDSSPLTTTDLPIWANSPVFGASIRRPPSRRAFCNAAETQIVNHLGSPGSGIVPGNRRFRMGLQPSAKVPDLTGMQHVACYHRLTSDEDES